MLTRRNLSIASALYASLLLLSVDCDLATKRLQKELKDLRKNPPPGVRFDFDSIAKDMHKWVVEIEGANGTLYEGEHFQLQFKFSPNYPMEKPLLQFVGPNIPRCRHVYKSGTICVSFDDAIWSPALNVRAVCLSILSMLSSATEKSYHPLGRNH